jgi:hypothetical protein
MVCLPPYLCSCMMDADGGNKLICGTVSHSSLCSTLNVTALQAYRSVNQVLGRVIRHRWDYGAIYLVDERFVLILRHGLLC